MRLRDLKVGCFGGGTGLAERARRTEAVPWVDLHAIVTMFDSGGSSGQLRDELGVLPPGDVLKCALTLARNEREAREILLARLPMLEHGRLAGHTGGNLLLSMMEQYTGDFIGGRGRRCATLLGCRGHVWPITVERATICAEYADGSRTTRRSRSGCGAGRRAARSGGSGSIRRCRFIREVAATIRSLDAVIIGPGSFFTSLLPIFLVDGCREALAEVSGPVIYVANLLTEGRGHGGLHRRPTRSRGSSAAIGRPDRLRGVQHRDAGRRRARALRARAQGAAAARQPAGGLRAGRGCILARADRAPRSAAACAAGDLGGCWRNTACLTSLEALSLSGLEPPPIGVQSRWRPLLIPSVTMATVRPAPAAASMICMTSAYFRAASPMTKTVLSVRFSKRSRSAP